MKTREQLLQLIRQYDFALYDLMLYLDTHTRCRQALQLYNKYNAERSRAAEEFVRRFGPLQASEHCDEDRWTWGKGPYPWEREAN